MVLHKGSFIPRTAAGGTTYIFADGEDHLLAEVFHIIVDQDNDYTLFAPKIGNIRIMDPDGVADFVQMNTSPAGGKLLLTSSNITDDILFEIDHNGTLIADADMKEIAISLDGLTINDGAGAVSLYGFDFIAGGIVATEVDGSTIVGARITNPTAGEYATERGILVTCDKSVVSNNAIALETSRDITGTLAAVESFTNYANIFGQNVTHSGGDHILTNDEGVVQINLNHNVTVACTDEDVFSATALDINVTADVNVVTSDALIDWSARAIDIAYTIAETDGVMRMADTDGIRAIFTIPDGLTSAGAFNFNAMLLNLNAVTLNDGNMSFNGQLIDMTSTTLTAYATAYAQQISVPTLPANSSAIHVIENVNDRIVDIITATNSILLTGDSIETSNWLEIKPSVQDIIAANDIRYIHVDTDNLTITDGATAPNIYGMHLLMNNITETDVNLTDLWGIYVDISATLANYADGAAAYFTDATQSVKILDGTTALTVVGGLALDTLDLTPTTNVDALDIILTNNAWTSSSGIHIDIGDWIGGSNIINIAASEAGTVATNAAMISIDAGTNITFSDAGAATQYFYGFTLDMSAITAANANMAGMAGINIVMPAGGHACWGANKVSAIHATGNGNIFDALLGDGLKLEMTEVGSIALNLVTDTEDLNNAILPIYITKDMNVTVAAAGGATLTNSGNTVDITIDTYSLDTTPAVNPHNTSAVGLHIYQRHRQGAANDVGNIDELFTGATLDLDQILTINNTNITTPSIVTTAPFIDMNLNVTETAGAVEIGAVDWVSLAIDGGSVVSAAIARGIVFDSDITLNHANAEFYGFTLDTTGMTDTLSQADSVGGMIINDDGILDYGIKATNATDTIKILDTENSNIINIFGTNVASSDWISIMPSAATVIASSVINFIHIDTDSWTINDGANTPTIRGGFIDFTGMDATDVGGTTINGLRIDMPEVGEYLAENGISIIANKTDDTNAIPLQTSRDITGTILSACGYTNYSIIHGQESAHSGGDFILTNDEGIMRLNLSHNLTIDTAANDVFSAIGMFIDVDAICNHATGELTATPRGIDIDFAITETSGTLELGTTDVFRVNFTDLNFSTAAAMSLVGVNAIVANAETFNDANITFKLINVDASNITNTASALLVGHDITMGASADAGLRVTMGATPAIGGIQVVMNAVTDIALTTNGEIVAGNYPEEIYLPFEDFTTGTLTNCTVYKVLDIAEDELALDINNDGVGAGSATIYFQFRIPTNFKEFPDTSDDIVIRAIQDAGASINATITINLLDNAGTDADDDSVAATVLTNAWATYDCATVTADGTWAVGDAVIVEVVIALPDIDDMVRIIYPKVLCKVSG